MASTSFNKTQRKSSKDTPTYESIRFSKDYDDKDSKFGESILEEDEGGHDQDYNKLSEEDQQVEENNGRKPRELEEASRMFMDYVRNVAGEGSLECRLLRSNRSR
ncbi:hypothetical protein Tco_0946432 [Tanacetum coccineum]